MLAFIRMQRAARGGWDKFQEQVFVEDVEWALNLASFLEVL